MTLDLNEHMEKKKREKHIKAYDEIGKAVSGMSIGTVLHILSAITADVMRQLDGPARMQAAMTFYGIIAEDPKEAGTPQ